MNPKFEAGVNIAIKIPKAKYDQTVSFYKNILQLVVSEQPINHKTVSRTHKVEFGHNIIWLDCVDNYTHSETWLQLTVTDVVQTKRYLDDNLINTCDELEELPDNMHWIQDPAGTVFHLKQHTEDS
ncbi:hypothetical protein [Sphingobacterium corticibacter]|uniref:Glyoxalase-like domain-containing protein n=1 Tax=Sphingobacterium corticibacter TaxID=2171749 RepID=A0A2T8HIB3_9SPHI|nr:hypothetical protein [Sphingobacterium corticibacter]PVH25186.1 hypothetical protein DC487_09680 [Sphingobacterium corticibacter]